MTSRERLLTALRRGKPDRVPVTLYEHTIYNDGWANREPSYAPLLQLEADYGDNFVRAPIDVPIFLDDPSTVTGTEEKHEDGTVVRNVQIDTPKGPLTAVSRRDPGLMTYWQVKPLLKTDEDIKRFLSLPESPAEVNVNKLRELERRVGDRGVLLFSIGDAVGHLVGLFDFQDFVMRASTDDGPILELLDKAQEQVLRAIRMIGREIDNAAFRLWGPEYCGAPLMNPKRFFPRYVLYRDKEATEAIHATGNFSIIHAHGQLDAVLEMIADTGADALEPIETLPLPTADVTLTDVKKRVGDRMCLMGAVQSVTLERGTPDDVRQQVREAIESAAKGGGFVLLPTAAPFMVPLSPEALANAEAMYQAAHEFGTYAE
jgi:hypothetical protein